MSNSQPPKCVLTDPLALAPRTSSAYPTQFQLPAGTREKRALGNALGLSHFGVNLTRILPGGMTAHRHWHTEQDEFVYVLEGELVLVTDEGETVLRGGMAAGFPAGVANGHHLINRGDAPATVLEVGDRPPNDRAEYPDVDLRVKMVDGAWVFSDKQDNEYPKP